MTQQEQNCHGQNLFEKAKVGLTLANGDCECGERVDELHHGGLRDALRHLRIDQVPQLILLLLVATEQASEPAEAQQFAYVVALVLRSEVRIQVDNGEVRLGVAVHLVAVEHDVGCDRPHVLVRQVRGVPVPLYLSPKHLKRHHLQVDGALGLEHNEFFGRDTLQVYLALAREAEPHSCLSKTVKNLN